MELYVLDSHYLAGRQEEEDMLHHLEVWDREDLLPQDMAFLLGQVGMAFDAAELVHTSAGVAFVVDLVLEVVAVGAQRQAENH